MINLEKSNTETELEYIWRLGQAKDSGALDMTWTELSNVFNRNLDHEEWNESAYRKKYQSAKQFYDEIFTKMVFDQYSKELMEQKRELERAKIAFRDERNAWQKQNYADSRVAANLDLLEQHIKATTEKAITVQESRTRHNSEPEMVICLSDWHIGACFTSRFGYYDADVARERIVLLASTAVQIAKRHGIHRCHVTVGGDMISGSIHRSIQVSNRENVIEQIVTASMLLSNFIYAMANHFETVDVVGVSGNHSRIDRKDDALTDERLDELLLWYCEADLSKCENVKIHRGDSDTTIATLDVCDNPYVVVHGDYDGFNDTAVCKLIAWLGYKPKCIIFGHKHHPAMGEVEGVQTVQTGSLCGSGDDFTKKSRLRGDASQSILVCAKHGVQCCYPVNLQ